MIVCFTIFVMILRECVCLISVCFRFEELLSASVIIRYNGNDNCLLRSALIFFPSDLSFEFV